MGNRAFVIFANKDWTKFSPAVYLHWNGGPESVYAFLEELNHREVRADQEYECARFVQIAGEFFDSNGHYTGLSLGVQSVPEGVDLEHLTQKFDPGDNGLYVVCREGSPKEGIVVRRFGYGGAEVSEKVVKGEREAVLLNDTYYEGIRGQFRAADRGRITESEWMKKLHFSKKGEVK